MVCGCHASTSIILTVCSGNIHTSTHWFTHPIWTKLSMHLCLVGSWSCGKVNSLWKSLVLSFLFWRAPLLFQSPVKAYSSTVYQYVHLGLGRRVLRDNIDRSCCQTMINVVTLEKKEVEGERNDRKCEETRWNLSEERSCGGWGQSEVSHWSTAAELEQGFYWFGCICLSPSRRLERWCMAAPSSVAVGRGGGGSRSQPPQGSSGILLLAPVGQDIAQPPRGKTWWKDTTYEIYNGIPGTRWQTMDELNVNK